MNEEKMQTDILKSFSNLQFELQEAKNCLKCVDENIRKIIGRDPSELPPKLNKKRLFPVDDKGRGSLKLINRIRNSAHDFDAPLNKKRSIDSVFKRLSTPTVLEDIRQDLQKQMISKVIVTSKEIPSREEVLVAQNKDEKFRARNRRMFGALLGTLQKFQQEETKLKPREEKRAQLEKKIEEHEIKEKEEIKKERHELFLNRKKKQMEIKIIELKISKMKEFTAWEECQRPRENFIVTKTQPQIHYLPRRINIKTKDLLSISGQNIHTLIENKSLLVYEELQHIEEKMMNSFLIKYGLKTMEQCEDKLASKNTSDIDHVEKTESSQYSAKNVTPGVSAVNDIFSPQKKYDGNVQNKENNHSVNSKNQEPKIIPLEDKICKHDGEAN